MMTVKRSAAAQIGDIARAVLDYMAALDAHASSVGEAAPVADPLIEAIVRVHGGAFVLVDDDAPDDSPPPVTYSKRRLFGAMTDAEFARFDTKKKGQSARKQAVFDHSTELVASDPDFPELRGLMVLEFGEARTAELLTAARVS